MESLVMKNFWTNHPVFVSGATGLVGSWLVKRLVYLGADVVCLVRDWVPQSSLVSSNFITKVKVVSGDVCNQHLLERILGEYEIKTVFHLAAQTTVSIANRNPISTFESNIRGTWNILEACRRSVTVEGIVIASSDKAYGAHQSLPYVEEMPLQGRYPYDVSKACADLLTQAYAESYKLPVVISRCGNFFGGGDLNWNRIIPGTIRSVLFGQNPIIRSDGKYIRDYFYVEDGVEAYILLAEKLLEMPNIAGEAFNFSTGVHLNVLEMVNKIIKLMGRDLKPVIRNEATNEIRTQYLSSSKAQKILAWRPTYSLDDGLLLTINWYKEFFSTIYDK